jgi:hypothetical protein
MTLQPWNVGKFSSLSKVGVVGGGFVRALSKSRPVVPTFTVVGWDQNARRMHEQEGISR